MRLIDVDITISELKTVPRQKKLEYMGIYDLLKSMPTIDAEPVVRCKDCIYWQDRKVRMKNGEYRDYLPDEDMFVSIDKGINVGSHCTLHGYENMPGSWFWTQANDFCSRGERRNCAKMDEEAEQK